jgi:hypothetical protein
MDISFLLRLNVVPARAKCEKTGLAFRGGLTRTVPQHYLLANIRTHGISLSVGWIPDVSTENDRQGVGEYVPPDVV